MKDEMMGKLKDLGNGILGKFGPPASVLAFLMGLMACSLVALLSWPLRQSSLPLQPPLSSR
jgi:hypothetical protein